MHFDKNASRCKAISWMEIYFSKQCDILPTTRRLHLFDNFTPCEVYQAHTDEMLLEGVAYIQYRYFNRLWRLQFNNVVIPCKVKTSVCSIFARLFKKYGKVWEIRWRNKELQESIKSQALNCSKAIHHQQKVLQSPERYMCMIIDGHRWEQDLFPTLSKVTAKGHWRWMPHTNAFSRLLVVLSNNKVSSLLNLS